MLCLGEPGFGEPGFGEAGSLRGEPYGRIRWRPAFALRVSVLRSSTRNNGGHHPWGMAPPENVNGWFRSR